MKAKDVMTTDIISVGLTDTVGRAAELMYHHNIGAVPVMDKGRVVGMLTDRDITVRVVAHHRLPDNVEVGEVMTASAISCSEDDDVSEVIRTMEYRRIRRVLVKNRRGVVSGIISVGDIAVRSNHEMAAHVVKDVSTESEELPPFRW